MKASQILAIILLIQYAGITVVCLLEMNWVRALYWAGAGILQTAIIFGMR
jgi:hypothetical protein